jgi:hypothetical protein
MPARIVTSTYRYKRPPRKKKPVLLEVPGIVRGSRQREKVSHDAIPPEPANDDRQSAETPSGHAVKSAIVTVKGRRSRFGDAPNVTSEEHQRRGEAAAALFREIVRRATAKD